MKTQKTTANANGFSDGILRFNVFRVRLPACGRWRPGDMEEGVQGFEGQMWWQSR